MKKFVEFGKSFVAGVLVLAIMLCSPLEAFAQSENRALLLENGSPVVLRVNENFNAAGKAETGIISAVVEDDVYSADGSRVLIKAGTAASLEFNAESNGSWGKAGKLCITHASTKTVDNKRVSLRMSNCQKGGSKLGGVIVLSVLFFPIGLISGCMKGGMPKIAEGTIFSATTTQDIICQ